MNRRQPIILFSTFVTAIGVHIVAIYSLQDLPLNSYLPTRIGWIDSTPLRISDSNQEIRKEETKRKNEELMHIFHEWRPPTNQTQNVIFDLKNISSDEFKTEWQDIENDVAASLPEEIDIISNEMTFKMDSEKSFLTEKILNTDSNIALDQLLAESEEILKELTSATDNLPGLVKAESSLSPADAPALLVGNCDSGVVANDSLLVTNMRSELDGTMQELLHSFFPSSQTDFQKGSSSFSQAHQGSQDEVNAAAAVASTQAFSLEVRYAKRSQDDGYLFRLAFVPKPGVVFKRIAQNYFFLIDRSHSIDPSRYEKSKSAVLKALSFLKKEDTFNIFIFDDRVLKLSSNNLSWNRENLNKAYEFLKLQKHGGMFATTDLYSSLGDIVPDIVSDLEVNTAILLSDGDTFLSKESQRRTIGNWTKKNGGKVSLYCMAAGKGNNLPLLELLSSFNKGFMRYSPDINAQEKTLGELMRTIQNPIGKDMVVTALVSPGEHDIKLYPKHVPDLYEDIPFVMYGTISDLKDFTIFLQGKYYDKWLDIKHVVSFNSAQEVPLSSLEKTWVTHQVFDLYDNYLKDGEGCHLVQAKQLLGIYKIPVAFQ